MKKILLTNLLVTVSLFVFAQQKAQFSQYMVNQYVLNPAVGGTEEYIDAKAGFRKQWLGFAGGPCTYYLTVHTPLGRPKPSKIGTSRHAAKSWHGVGLYLYDDITGTTRRNGALFSYAYNMPLTKKLRLSVGAYGGFQQFIINGDKFQLYDQQDQTLNGVHSTTVPDLILGAWLYHDRYYLGIAAHQILQNQLEFTDITMISQINGTDPSKLNNHYFITGGYAMPFGHLTIIPSFMIKYVNPAPVSVDLSCKASYRDGMFWGGVAYRSFDAVTVMVGTTILDGKMPISYSYDLTTSELIKYQTGSHEIVVGYRIPPKPRVPCPHHFWD